MHKDTLPLSFECDQDWEQMAPCHQGRHCTQCQHMITDVSAMTLEQFLMFSKQQAGQRVCIKYLYNQKQQIVFAASQKTQTSWSDYSIVSWLGQQQTRLKAASIAGATTLALAACTPQPSTPKLQHHSSKTVHFDQINPPQRLQRSSNTPPLQVTITPQNQEGSGHIDIEQIKEFNLVLGQVTMPNFNNEPGKFK